MCKIPVELHAQGDLQVAEEHLVVSSPDLSLPVFEFLPVRCSFNASRPQQRVEIGLLLQRRNGAFMLSSIGPCVVLALLGHLSFLAFPLHLFTDRASTSLSLLIVVAALFSQASHPNYCYLFVPQGFWSTLFRTSSTLPASSGPKAIDMWFFYWILRFFFFFLFHCIVEFQHRKVTAAANKKLRQASLIKETLVLPVRPPSPPLDKGKGAATHQIGQWLTDDNHDVSPAASMSPEKVNKICFVFGIIHDVLFLVVFVLYLNGINRYFTNIFYTFKDCSTQE
ncbi:uncharacterized protein LOC126982203 [Eriocheir sinensis]|uniref:uncharacterized protein LOC126982203 n=1 Tax=Eriocheir sinensis TaxID=95602 RepID=UPI0021C8436A|nr:uncharacterized protein LOC126982203 [Eriocheir sinensis]